MGCSIVTALFHTHCTSYFPIPAFPGGAYYITHDAPELSRRQPDTGVKSSLTEAYRTVPQRGWYKAERSRQQSLAWAETSGQQIASIESYEVGPFEVES